MANIRMEDPEAELELVPQTDGLFTVNIKSAAPAAGRVSASIPAATAATAPNAGGAAPRSGSATTDNTRTSSSSSAAQELVHHPKIKGMLEVLAFTEGTGNNYGKVVNGTVISSPHHPELVGKKNVSVTDLSQHPNILVQVNATIKSTAAGRYQFLKRTWDGLGMQDFQPKSQDIAAVRLMMMRGMIEPLLTDNLRKAVSKGAPEWASLPTEGGGSFFGGQPARTISEIEKKYNEALA